MLNRPSIDGGDYDRTYSRDEPEGETMKLDDYMTTAEAAKACDVPLSEVYRYCKNGRLTALDVTSQCKMVSRASVKAFVKQPRGVQKKVRVTDAK